MIDALVLGRSLPALLAALDLAEVGLSVAVTDGSPDLPTEPERDPGGGVTALLERIAAPIDRGSGDGGAEDRAAASAAHPVASPRCVAPQSPWLLDRAGQWAPQSPTTVMGIPAVPLAEQNLRLLGSGAATRAYLDRLTPLLTVGKTRTLGDLVRRRLGAKAVAHLVGPLVRERYGVPAHEVDAAVAAPGLNEALSRAGSLTAAALAYSERHEERETGVEPLGGWEAMADAVLARLAAYGVELLEARPERLHPQGDTWRVELGTGRDGERSDEQSGERPLVIDARAVVLDGADQGTEGRFIDDWIPALGRPLRRAYAEIDIQFVDGLPPEASGVRTVDDWSIRISPESPEGVRRARLIGPAGAPGTGTGGDAGDAGDAGVVAQGAAVLAASGLVAVEGAQWSTTRRAARFATLEQRRAAEEASGQVRFSDSGGPLLAVGRQVHGDDLSAALAAAHRGATALRRRLLGLTD